jgi:hypothetical protein
MLKYHRVISETHYESVNLIHLAQDKVHRRSLMMTDINIRVPLQQGIY